MALWEPPPPVRVRRTLKPGHYVRIVGNQAGAPDSERHCASLAAARRFAYSLIQESLSKSEECMSVEFEIQILQVGQDGSEKLHEGFDIHAERYLALRERLVGQG